MEDLLKTSTFNKDLIFKNTTLIIGLSGGPDSVYLLYQLNDLKKNLNLTLIAVHIDHEWRPCSSDDALFCKELCKKLDITFKLIKASEVKKTFTYNGSKEAQAREMRRFVFEQQCEIFKADGIVLAHNLDDQQETFFINLIRGTSLTGLCGISSIKDFYIRPMLSLTKKEILDYLCKNNISYCIDPTNQDPSFLRNRIRSTVLPALFACDERAQYNFARTIEQLKKVEDCLNEITLDLFYNIVFVEEPTETTGSIIDLAPLFDFPKYLQKRILIHWMSMTLDENRISEAFLDEIIRFLKSPRGGKHDLSPDWSIIKKKNKAQIVQH